MTFEREATAPRDRTALHRAGVWQRCEQQQRVGRYMTKAVNTVEDSLFPHFFSQLGVLSILSQQDSGGSRISD